jgi:hypothetical protein
MNKGGKEGTVWVAPELAETAPSSEIEEKPAQWGGVTSVIPGKSKVQLRFQVPKGKVSQIMGVMNLLQSKFRYLEIEIVATDGEISEQDYEDKIKESFRQLGIEVDDR